jgi:hypothetical protein
MNLEEKLNTWHMGLLTSGGTRCGEKKPTKKGSKVAPLLLFSKFPTICTDNKSKNLILFMMFLMAFLDEGQKNPKGDG